MFDKAKLKQVYTVGHLKRYIESLPDELNVSICPFVGDANMSNAISSPWMHVDEEGNGVCFSFGDHDSLYRKIAMERRPNSFVSAKTIRVVTRDDRELIMNIHVDKDMKFDNCTVVVMGGFCASLTAEANVEDLKRINTDVHPFWDVNSDTVEKMLRTPIKTAEIVVFQSV